MSTKKNQTPEMDRVKPADYFFSEFGETKW